VDTEEVFAAGSTSPAGGSAGAFDRQAMAAALLNHRQADGTIATHPYKKWQGPHWTLHSLAQLGYPPGDESLRPLLEQVHRRLLSPQHLRPPSTAILPGQADRVRRCASQEGVAVWYSLKLGLADERTEELVSSLVTWQWPDGGWNCDKRPQALTPSFQETLLPLRGLALYVTTGRDLAAQAEVSWDRAAELLLSRRLLWRRRDGMPIRPDWGGDPLLIQYPVRFYDLLLPLVVMTEIGKVSDPRCSDALDLLEGKRLADGGFPVELRTAVTSPRLISRGTFADWGPAGHRRSNPFVTAEAELVLRHAGRGW
jgi:hypothetical protein